MKLLFINSCSECKYHELDNQEIPALYGKDVCWNDDHPNKGDKCMPVVLDKINTEEEIDKDCPLSDVEGYVYPEIDSVKREAGEYCQKGVPDCLCKIGWPPDLQCFYCREEKDRDSFCVCPPKDMDTGYIPEHDYRLNQERAEYIEYLINEKTQNYRRIAEYFSEKYPDDGIGTTQLEGQELIRLAMLQLDKPLLNFVWKGKRVNDDFGQ